MPDRRLLCFAHGREGSWEAICLDFDVAVQGHSFEEVRNSLSQAISDYIERALEANPADRDRLLRRRAPLHVWFGYWGAFIVHAILRRRDRDRDGEGEYSFVVPCHA